VRRSDTVRRGNRLLLVLLVLTAIVLINLDVRLGAGSPLDDLRQTVAGAIAPAQDGLGVLAQPVLGLAGDRAAARDARVEGLEAEVARLQSQVRTAAVDRGRVAQLDSLLRLATAAQFATVPAQVVAVSPAELSERTVVIDVGSADGIATDMTVLNGDGLVGRVLSVTASTATVQLLLDPAAQVGVRMAGSGQLGLARGGQVVPDRRDVLGSDVLGFELLDRLAPMVDGDVVVTFGSPGGRPFVPGVPVGVLRDVAGGYGATARIATLVPYVDFSSLDLVGVVVEPPRTDPRDLLVPVTSPPVPAPEPAATPVVP